MDARLIEAIRQRRLIGFGYHRHHRLAEPHVYGRCGGVDQLLVYQLAGGSDSGALPDWRRVDVAGISDLTLLEERFAGPRSNPSGRHSAWDEIYELVYLAEPE